MSDEPRPRKRALLSAWRRVDRSLPLLVKVGLPMLAIAIVSAAAVGEVLTRRTDEHFQQAYEGEARLLAHVVATEYETTKGNDPAEVAGLLDELRSVTPLLVSVRIYKEEDGRRVLWASSGVPASSDGSLDEKVYPIGSIRSPAWVELVLSSSEIDQVVAETQGDVLRVLLLAAVVAIAGWGLILWIFVLRRSARLARAAKRVAGGDLSVRLPEGDGPRGHDALVNVAREFDRMIRVVEARTRELAAAEGRYRALVEQIPAVVYVENNDDFATATYVSPYYEKLVGYAPEERVSDPEMWMRLIHPDDRDRVMAEHLGTNLTGRPFRCEYRMVGKDGRAVWVRDEAIMLTDEGGEKRWQGILIDITERKEAEDALERLSVQKQSILDSAGEGIFGLDPAGRVSFVNPAAAQMTGWNAEELIGKSSHEMVHHTREDGSPYPKDECPIFASVTEGARYHVVGELFWRRDASCFPVEYTSTPIFEDGRVAGAVVVFSDITERSRAEDALREAYEREREAAERLRSVDEMKNAFLSAVSHELRTPLSSVLGFAVTLQRDDPPLPEADRKEMLDRLAANAEKLQQLLADLLDLDRMARGILEPQRQPVDVAELVLRVTEEVEHAGHLVSVDAEPVIVEVDGPKVERIVENLVINASKHTPAGTPVRVQVRRQGEGVLLVVEDEGSGVPDYMKEAIFRPFERGRDARRNSAGTGIGLSLVSRFAELHGGRAWVEDRAGGGSSFRVFLPGGLSQPVEASQAGAGGLAP
ncbi:MAG: PAS domain S-box protein [Actinomycetota bacterium]|nr:PAS domain S-box protein [Actinomycetota bacterium]